MFIQLKNYVPETYYKQSRDFQLLGRLYDVVLNSVSTNIDMIYSIPNAEYASSSLIELLSLTLGFKPKHDYNIKHLIAVCSILPSILQVKGTLIALDLICRALLSAEGLTSIYSIRLETDDRFRVFILIPNLQSTTLLNDLLDYVLPSGMACRIITAENIISETVTTKIGVTANVAWNYTGTNYYSKDDNYWETDREWNIGELNNLISRGSLISTESIANESIANISQPSYPMNSSTAEDATYAIPGDIISSFILSPQTESLETNPTTGDSNNGNN